MRFIARQPVFDRSLNVFGYELLFRRNWENSANIVDSEQASCSTLDNSILWGLDHLCDGKVALVNCTREVLVNRLVEVLPPERTIIEVLEDVRADEEVLQACRIMHDRGYLIALDDVTNADEVTPYLGVAGLVKVDFRLTTAEEQSMLAHRLSSRGIKALAEKVETQEEYRQAAQMGYQLFQGFFLQRPEIMRKRDIPAVEGSYLRLLNAIHAAELDLHRIERAIQREPSLCFRLLRYLNSPLFAFEEGISSVRHALRLLGDSEIKRWVWVAVAATLGKDSPPELVIWSLTRGRFCELLADRCAERPNGAFLMGMVSSFPALLGVPLDAIMERLAVSPEIKAALSGEPGRHRDVLDIMSAYEEGNWSCCGLKTEICGLSEGVVTACYAEAVDWTKKGTSITA